MTTETPPSAQLLNCPDVIYLTDGDGDEDFLMGEYNGEGLMWCADKITDHDVKYVRTPLLAEHKFSKDGYVELPARECFRCKEKDALLAEAVEAIEGIMGHIGNLRVTQPQKIYAAEKCASVMRKYRAFLSKHNGGAR